MMQSAVLSDVNMSTCQRSMSWKYTKGGPAEKSETLGIATGARGPIDGFPIWVGHSESSFICTSVFITKSAKKDVSFWRVKAVSNTKL